MVDKQPRYTHAPDVVVVHANHSHPVAEPSISASSGFPMGLDDMFLFPLYAHYIIRHV